MIRNYELTYLTAPDFSEEELKSFCDKIGGFVAGEVGIIQNQSNPIRRRLTYPIKKKTEAFLVTAIFKIDAGNLEKIEKKLKAENEILRYIIMAKKPKKLIKERRTPAPYEKISDKERKTAYQKKAESSKIELKELDKKIEEILNQ